ncbi:MAG TPA: AAA family ATPase [Longimicrobiales bacterium]
MIEIRTLGELSVLRDGERVRLASSKECALLVYLVLHEGRVFRREQLAALLWPEAVPSRARHSLSQALYGLRRRLPGLPFCVEGEEIRVPIGAIRCDAVTFRAAVNDGRLEEALELYQGAFLEGFWVNGAGPFEEWQERVRDELRHMAERAVRSLLLRADAGGEWHEVERLATRLLQLDPFQEEAHRLRIRAIAAAGDRPRALREYQRVRALLLEDLGREPEAETIALAEQIRHAEVEPGSVCQEGEEGCRIPFVGRESEFRRLREEWARIRAGAGRAVIVTGEAGIGKTRLCQHFLRLAAIQGARVLQGRAYPSESHLAYSPVVDALVNGLRPADLGSLPPAWTAVVAELLPELQPDSFGRGEALPLEGEGARRRLFEGVARLLRAVSAGAPVALFIDDLQWADESTVALVHYLARRLTDAPVLLLLAVRPEDITEESRVGLLLHSGGATEIFLRIHLGELDRAAAECLIASYVEREGFRLPEELRERIYAQAGGRPFFLLETLRAIRNNEAGGEDLCATARTGPRHQVLLAASVEEFLRRRLEELGEEAGRVVDSLAVLGREAEPGLVQAVSDLPTPAFVRGVQEAARKGFVRDLGEKIAFPHDLVREAAYRRMSSVLRRALHARAGEELERSGEAQPGTLAVHYDLAGDGPRAFRFAVLAADASARVYAVNEMEFFLRMALANAANAKERFGVQEKLADHLFGLRRYAEAERHFAELEAEYERRNHVQGLLKARFNRLWIHGRQQTIALQELFDRLQELAEKAEEIGDRDRFLEILLAQASFAHDAGRPDIVHSITPRLIELGRAAAGRVSGVRALSTAATIICMYGTVREGMAVALEALEYAERSGDPRAKLAALSSRAVGWFFQGRIDLAEEGLLAVLELAERAAWVEGKLLHQNSLGVVLTEKGDHAEAERLFREALGIAAAAGANHELPIFYCNLSVLYYEVPDLRRAREAAERFLSCPQTEGTLWGLIMVWGILGLCALEEGDVAEAERCRREVLTHLGARDYWVTDLSYPEMLLARCAALEGEVERAVSRLERVIAAYQERDVFCCSRLELERARLLLDRDPEEARRVAGRIRGRAAAMGARPLVAKADAILERLSLRH